MNEQNRAYIYRVLVAAVPVAIVYGVLDEATAAVWIGLAAAVLGVRLFEADQPTLAAHLQASGATLALLPRSVRPTGGAVKDDF